jgi:DNA-binding CsgD family transcriptional regulator
VNPDPAQHDEEFHSELERLLLADDPDRARDALLEGCRTRSVAGLCCFDFQTAPDAEWRTRPRWVEDLSGELDGLHLDDVIEHAFSRTPDWLLRWTLGRKTPFQLRRFARFIPFSARTILRATAPRGRRPLSDFLVVALRDRDPGIALVVGLFETIDKRRADRLVLLASAYLSKQPAAEPKAPVTVLTPRQLECLQWIVAGKSLEETASITGMSYSTVRYHLERAKSATGLPSLPQLIAWAAVEYGLSPMGPEPERASDAVNTAPDQAA